PHLARFPPLPLLPHPHHVSPLLSSHCPARHRDLHSFPTRRSSDLSPTLFADQALLHVLVSGPSSRSDQQSGEGCPAVGDQPRGQDRKSTRLNSSHVKISYAVFCLKKKMYSPQYCDAAQHSR